MKELETKWIVATFDYLRTNTSIATNGFKAAGIIDAIQKGLQPAATEIDDDPFVGLDSD